jgi:hypothetical protein
MNTRRNTTKPCRVFTSMTVFALINTTLLVGCGGGSTLEEPDARVGQAVHGQARALSADQAATLERRLDINVVAVNASCCGAGAADLDVLIAFGVQAAADLPNDAAFVVRGSHAQQAAAVAQRLGEMGASQVYLVTP